MGKSPGLIAAAVVPDILVAAFIGVLISTIGYAVALRVTAAANIALGPGMTKSPR